MTFSEFIRQELNIQRDYFFESEIESLIEKYNTYLQEQQNQPVTSEFLIGLGFRKTPCYYELIVNDREIILDLVDKGCSITDFIDEIKLPFLKTQKDVTDLMRLMELK